MAEPLFHRAHHNILAAQFRIQYLYWNNRIDHEPKLPQLEALTNLALLLAERLLKDNRNFDPLKFLDACSPDVDTYPLSELWEDYINA